MDTKLLTPLDCFNKFVTLRGLNEVIDLFKDIQRNAIEVAVRRCSEEADADYDILDRNVMGIHDTTIEKGITPIECYVINSSILNCKQKLFEENNLI